MIFYTPPSVDPFDPLEEYPGLDNGAHIDYYDDLKELVDSVENEDQDADIIDVLPDDVKDRIPDDDDEEEDSEQIDDGLDKEDDLSEDSDDNGDETAEPQELFFLQTEWMFLYRRNA